MKLYDFGPAVNAQRVRVFLAEKGLEVPTEQLNVREDHQFAEPFTLDEPLPTACPSWSSTTATVIAESVSICRYLEELHPEPALFGATRRGAGPSVDMWQRRFELDGFLPSAPRGAQPCADVRGEGGARHPHRTAPSSRRW